MSNVEYSLNSSVSSSHQINCPLNITQLGKEIVTSMSITTMASSSEYLKQEVTTTVLASPIHLQQDAQLDLSAQVLSSHYNLTQTSSCALSLDGKLSDKSLEIAKISSKNKSALSLMMITHSLF